MNQSNYGRSQPPRAIRAGLSVQELKAMTAARMAQSGEQIRVQGHQNPATSYQTANPQQLQAAGITPVVINDRLRPVARPVRGNSFSTPFENREVGPSNNSMRNFNGHNAPPSHVNQLSTYHQQILPHRNVPTNGHTDHYFESKMRSYPDDMLNSLLVDKSHHHDHRSFANETSRIFTPEKFMGQSDYSNPSVDNISPRVSLPQINTTPRFSGPEVRSPDTARRQHSERFFVPDEESEHYNVDAQFSLLNISTDSPLSNAGNSLDRRPKFARAQSTSNITGDSSPFTLPNAGSNIITSGFLPTVSPAATSNFPSYRSEAADFSESFNESPVVNGNERGPFPFKKSKTAPKLVIHSSPLSPGDSPNFKLFGRKNSLPAVSLSPLRDRGLLDPNFLASEVAEAVLDTPSSGSTPFGRKFFLQPDLPLKRGLSNSTLQPIDLSGGDREAPKAETSDWRRTPSPNARVVVSNQCESEDAEEKFQDPLLQSDSTNNSPRYFLNVDQSHKLAPLN